MVETNQKYSKYIKGFWIGYISIWLLLAFVFFSISSGLLGFMPSFEELENPKSNIATEIYSSDQVLLGKYYIENRSITHYNELSPNVIYALIATEDARFHHHSGVDIKAIFRAIYGVVTSDSKGGGSTLTQQLAKNLFPREENPSIFKMVFIKLKEWVTAIKLERNYTKEEILAMYLTTVDFGSQSFGIKSASKTYFNKIPAKLSATEAATLIGMLKAPTYYSPVRNPERSMQRRNVVLNQMLKYGYLTEEQYDELRNQPMDLTTFRIQDQNEGLAAYFREFLRMYLKSWCESNLKPDGTSYNLYKDGLKIYTTINSKMQKYAEEAVSEHLGKELQNEFFNHWKGYKNAPFDLNVPKKEIDKLFVQAMKRSDRYAHLKLQGLSEEEITKNFNTPIKMTVFSWKGDIDTVMSPMDSIKYYKYFLLSGLMSVEPETGYVRAYVGGINYRYFKYDHVMFSKRQVGSTFKPFLYTLAMQEGEFSPCTKVPNIPVSFDMPDKTTWTPKNSDDKNEGEMVTLKWALANSVNYISAFLMKRYSPQAVIKIAKKMGITSDLPPVYSLCLGTCELSVSEMTGAFATFANRGVHIEPMFITRIEDKNGNVLARFVPKTEDAISEETAYLMISLLKGVVESGTGARLRGKYQLTNAIAGKTGTTQNNSDGWFMGITPHLVTGVWVGAEDRSVHFRSTALGQGANMALPIWALYMKKVYDDKTLNIKKDEFPSPLKKISFELDCDKYDNAKNNRNSFDNSGFIP